MRMSKQPFLRFKTFKLFKSLEFAFEFPRRSRSAQGEPNGLNDSIYGK